MNDHVSLSIAGAELEVVALSGREELGELFHFELRCVVAEAAPSPRDVLGGETAVHLHAGGGVRTVHGIVSAAERRFADDGTVQLLVEVRPAAFALTLGRSCRTFLDASVRDVVDQVLAAIPHRWELSGSYPVRAYWAQYREDDWSFMRRLLEDAGIYLWFDHEQGSMLVLGDRSSAAPELAGGPHLDFASDSGLDPDREVVFELAAEGRAMADRFTVRSFDPARPQLSLEAGEGTGGIEHYDAPGGGPRDPDACASLARIQREAAAAAGRRVAGSATSVRLSPGRIVEISGHPAARFDRRYLVVGVEHELVQRRRGETTEPAYGCRFAAIPADVPYRLPRATPPPRQPGLQSALVLGPPGEEIHPDAEGRVRVQLHWDREGSKDDRAGRWVRVAQRGTADSMLLPRVGWNVLTFNEEGAVDEPSVLSRIHDAEHPPSHGLPGNQTRVVFRSATSPADGTFNEIYFEDTDGAEEMHLTASRDMSVLVHNEESFRVGRDHTRRIARERRVAVGADASELVDRDQSITVTGDESVTVHGSRNKAVAGDESERIGNKRSLHVGAAHGTTVRGSRDLDVGAVLVDATLGPIGSTAGSAHHVLVGGAAVKMTADAMSEQAGMGAIQTIGGVKLEVTNENRSMQAKLIRAETVGGAMVLDTQGKWTSHTEVATSWTVGGLLSMGAPALTLEAKSQIVLQAGASTITLTPSDVEIVAPAFDLDDAAVLDAMTGRIDHN